MESGSQIIKQLRKAKPFVRCRQKWRLCHASIVRHASLVFDASPSHQIYHYVEQQTESRSENAERELPRKAASAGHAEPATDDGEERDAAGEAGQTRCHQTGLAAGGARHRQGFISNLHHHHADHNFHRSLPGSSFLRVSVRLTAQKRRQASEN